MHWGVLCLELMLVGTAWNICCTVHPVPTTPPTFCILRQGWWGSHSLTLPTSGLSSAAPFNWVPFKIRPILCFTGEYTSLAVLSVHFTNVIAVLSGDRSDPLQKISLFTHQAALSNIQYSVLHPFPVCKALLNTLSDWPSLRPLEIPEFFGHFLSFTLVPAVFDRKYFRQQEVLRCIRTSLQRICLANTVIKSKGGSGWHPQHTVPRFSLC